MKKFVLLAAIAAVAACSKPATAPEAEASTAAVESAPVAENIAADGKSSVGKFKITSSDGEIAFEEDKVDGTYVTTSDGNPAETGKWVQKSSGVFCYTKDEKVPVEKCNEEKVENGVWTTKGADGKVSTVERLPS